MSALTNYEELSLAQWESAGQIACFCVDPTVLQYSFRPKNKLRTSSLYS